MFKYAQIDLETGHCVSVSYLADAVEYDYMVLLEDENDVQSGDIYLDGEWTRPDQELQNPPGDRIDVLESSLLFSQVETEMKIHELESNILLEQAAREAALFSYDEAIADLMYEVASLKGVEQDEKPEV